MADTVHIIEAQGAAGAQVQGVDLSRPLGAHARDSIRHAVLERGVVCFRDQSLSQRDQLDFTALFGPPQVHVRAQDGDALPGIFIVSNVVRDGKPIGALGHGEIGFHSDLAYLPRPGTLSTLYAREVPGTGGSTHWCHSAAAYDALDAPMKRRLDGLKAIHRHVDEGQNPAQPVAHPIISEHPESGRRSLYLTPLFTRAIVGLAPSASRALLDQLFAHMCDPRFVWSHQWRVGDLVVWDNRLTMHRRDPFDAGARRLMHRTQVFNDWVPTAPRRDQST